MLFNSFEFAIFLPISFLLYWFVFQKHLRLQNFFILTISYLFYGWWDWRFLSLILFSSLIDFIAGQQIENSDDKTRKKIFLWISICTNLGFLGFFKYFNFFADSFAEMVGMMGFQANPWSLKVILPIGISFYAFQTMSYTIDIYRGKMKAEKNLIVFLAFVSFFPQLVAGPIERATNLLPQFYKKRIFEYHKAIDGLRQILWGLFKKVVIADNCAEYANLIFNNSADYGGSTLFVGAVFFAFQIYGDFSGYSDIAIGTAKLFGFNLMQNFAFPYFSRDIAEFWRRWHISLSTWFRDYVYIPLGGSKGGTWFKVRNTFIIFIVSGFWHGANWTFLVWGALNALYFLPLLLLNKNRHNLDIVAKGKIFPTFKELSLMLITFLMTGLSWVFFRAENVGHATAIISEMFSISFLSIPAIQSFELYFLIIFFLLIEWAGREGKYAIEKFFIDQSKYLKWSMVFFMIMMIYVFGNFSTEYEFIYFQF